MSISITTIFEACCRVTGKRLETRGKFAKCVFHESKAYQLGLSEERMAWHCFSGKCPTPKGGYLDVPVAFGIARDRAEAARWLSDQRLIPPREKSADWKPRVVRVPKRAFVQFTQLTREQAEVYIEAQVLLRETLGRMVHHVLHNYSAELRYARHLENQKHLRIIKRNLLELIESEKRRPKDIWGPNRGDRLAVYAKYPELYDEAPKASNSEQMEKAA